MFSVEKKFFKCKNFVIQIIIDILKFLGEKKPSSHQEAISDSGLSFQINVRPMCVWVGGRGSIRLIMAQLGLSNFLYIDIIYQI